jgi:hypothetical protein
MLLNLFIKDVKSEIVHSVFLTELLKSTRQLLRVSPITYTNCTETCHLLAIQLLDCALGVIWGGAATLHPPFPTNPQ